MEDGVVETIAEKYRILGRLLDERGTRLWAAAEARSPIWLLKAARCRAVLWWAERSEQFQV